jgi:translation initiation factor IF-2
VLAKNLKLNIKNAQIAEAVNLSSLKEKLASRKAATEDSSSLHEVEVEKKSAAKEPRAEKKVKPEHDTKVDKESTKIVEGEDKPKEEVKRVRARKRSMFAEPRSASSTEREEAPEGQEVFGSAATVSEEQNRDFPTSASPAEKLPKHRRGDLLRKEIFGETELPAATITAAELFSEEVPATGEEIAPSMDRPTVMPKPAKPKVEAPPLEEVLPLPKATLDRLLAPKRYANKKPSSSAFTAPTPATAPPAEPSHRLGPTGKHMRDFLTPKPKQREVAPAAPQIGRGGEDRRHGAPRSDARPEHRGEGRGHERGPGGRSGEQRPFERSHERAGHERSHAEGRSHERGPAEGRRHEPRAPSEIRGGERGGESRDFSRSPPKEGQGSAESAAGKKPPRSGFAKTGNKEFKDVKPSKKQGDQKSFDARDRYGLRGSDEDQQWRKKRTHKAQAIQEDTTIRPSQLKVRLPITVKDLAVDMKLKASQLLAKLFMQGVILTLNDQISDETTVQLLGHEFGCEITIDTAEQERIRVTDKSIQEEISQADVSKVVPRAPVVAFMGHVDHGKTSLIDYIRKSNRVSGEAGAITQHIGAFRCSTAVGDIAILDTPGHEAFSAMRARGAHVTDIVVLVVAGDEGIRQQTIEAIQHAKAAGVTIIVAINKCDKPNFNTETVYRQLAEQDLLPEAWGGQIITVNCSAVTGEGIPTLLEMLALQSEVLEIKADPTTRARGSVLESEMHKGMGAVATILVQNGTLRHGDAVVFESLWGRIKTMRDEHGRELKEAGPSTPVSITGLSGLPDAGEEFIVVKNEKEAREIAEARLLGMQQERLMQKRKLSLESLFQQASDSSKKVLNVVLRTDVQGSLEALRTALEKIESTKVALNIIFAGIGEVTESDVQLAAASKAMILGYHTQVENHADALIKEIGVQVRLHDVIYHAIDDVKDIMAGLLEKVAQEEIRGRAIVRATFKSSQHGVIAGCIASEGTIHRNNKMRVIRAGETIWQGDIASLRRVKEDVREVQKGVECGILLNGMNDLKEDDILEAYQLVYHTQQL